jgi:hypothetical protein
VQPFAPLVRTPLTRNLVERLAPGQTGYAFTPLDEFNVSHRAFGLPDELLAILKDNLTEHGETVRN